MDELGIAENLSWDKKAYNNNLGRMDSLQRASWDEFYDPIIEDFKERFPKMNKQELMKWRYQRYMQDYLASIASVDEGVGDVLDYLKANGLEGNTIVIYTSDQGFYMGEHGWFDKRFMYEESLRTPLLIKYPKEIKPGIKIDEMVQNLDFAPTFLDYAGVEIPKDMQGMSIRGLTTNKNSEWRDAIYYTYYEYPSIHMVKRHYGIRTERYKLIHFYYDIDEWELYDLKKDPQEMQNVYHDPAYTKVKDRMHKRLKELREKYGDSKENDDRFIKEYLEATKKKS
jgi:arylsulfatase A-like enzyme